MTTSAKPSENGEAEIAKAERQKSGEASIRKANKMCGPNGSGDESDRQEPTLPRIIFVLNNEMETHNPP